MSVSRDRQYVPRETSRRGRRLESVEQPLQRNASNRRGKADDRDETVTDKNGQTPDHFLWLLGGMAGFLLLFFIIILSLFIDSSGPTTVAKRPPLSPSSPNVANSPSSTSGSDAPVTRTTPENAMLEAELVRFASPSVVMVEGVVGEAGGRPGYVELSTGTGFLYNNAGLILTNEHVVRGARSLRVTFSNSEPISARIVAKDETLDLAVLVVEPPVRPDALPLLDEPLLEIGEKVIVLGYPYGRSLGREVTLTNGLVSSVRRTDGETWYQINAPINPGNSGGPCLDMRGRVVGVVTKMLTEAAGVGFVRPIRDSEEIRKQASVNLK